MLFGVGEEGNTGKVRGMAGGREGPVEAMI
jgi:hypothetical protein